MKINWKEIELKKVTVGINEQFQSILLEGATMWTDGNLQINVANTPKANIYLVSACTGLDQDEIREWTTEDFDQVLQLINKKAVPEKKS